MGRPLNKLTARAVQAATKPGRLSDGGGIYLKIDATRRRWIFRYVRHGKAHELGLGACPAVSLAEARRKATEARRALGEGIDPLEAKRTALSARAAVKTFGQCAEALIESKRSGWRSAVHAAQWSSTLETHAAPLWGIPVDTIDTRCVLGILQPIWGTIPETASRLRGRIEATLDFARANGFIAADKANPSRWRGHLDKILPKRAKHSRAHLGAMEYSCLPEFVAGLRQSSDPAAKTLEFLILAASRSGEVVGATWGEFDLARALWVIPGSRMKTGVLHRVPLTQRALEILSGLAESAVSERVFAHGSMRRLVPRPATVHGCRSTFSTWAAEQTSFARETVEESLAHTVGNETERAYRRTDALQKRRALMESWAQFLDAKHPASNVVRMAR